MGVYIKGMEMRERCNDQDGHWSCPLFGSIYPHGFFCKATTKEIGNPFSKQPDCPLVPVPAHGRLIEKSALLNKCYQHYEDYMFGKIDGKTALLNIEKEIKAAPVIIPAEEG